jgi:hypothetical protein
MSASSAVAQWVSAVGQIMIGCGVVFIAWRQHRTARDKLRFEQYERRLAVWVALKELFGEIRADGNISIQSIFSFRGKTHEASFLFGPEIVGYLDTVTEKAAAFRSNRTRLDAKSPPDGKTFKDLCNIDSDLLNWFIDQNDNAARALFAKYLRFE